jgi:hypothetical protein
MKNYIRHFAAAAALALPLAAADAAPANANTPAPACSTQQSMLDAWECMEDHAFLVDENQRNIDSALSDAYQVLNRTRFSTADRLTINQYLDTQFNAVKASCSFADESLSNFFNEYNATLSRNINPLHTPLPATMQTHADNYLRAAYNCHARLIGVYDYMMQVTGRNPAPVAQNLRAGISPYMR